MSLEPATSGEFPPMFSRILGLGFRVFSPCTSQRFRYGGFWGIWRIQASSMAGRPLPEPAMPAFRSSMDTTYPLSHYQASNEQAPKGLLSEPTACPPH